MRASVSESHTSNVSPAVGTASSPNKRTARDGPASSTPPAASAMVRTLPWVVPATTMSPGRRVPAATMTVAQGPERRSRWASMTVPAAGRDGLADSCSSSATRAMVSNKSSTPVPFLAEMLTHGTSPPHSSHTTPASDSSRLTRSGLAPSLSILLMATMMGTPAALAWEIASTVWGRTPSSAATMMTAMSVTRVPRARIAENASCPGVSKKVISFCPSPSSSPLPTSTV